MATGARSVEREDPEPAQLTREELAALVDEAHRLGLRVAAHAEGLDGARLAIEESVDTIEHGLSLHREPALLDRMAASGQVARAHALDVPRSRRALRGPVGPAPGRPGAATTRGGLPHPGGGPRSRRHTGNGFRLGSSRVGTVGIRAHGRGRPWRAPALRAATAGGAAALGRSDVGRLAPGAAADLIVLDGDPLADPRLLVRPGRMHLVVRDGVAIAGRELDATHFNRQAPPPDDTEMPQPIGQPSCCMPAGVPG